MSLSCVTAWAHSTVKGNESSVCWTTGYPGSMYHQSSIIEALVRLTSLSGLHSGKTKGLLSCYSLFHWLSLTQCLSLLCELHSSTLNALWISLPESLSNTLNWIYHHLLIRFSSSIMLVLFKWARKPLSSHIHTLHPIKVLLRQSPKLLIHMDFLPSWQLLP